MIRSRAARVGFVVAFFLCFSSASVAQTTPAQKQLVSGLKTELDRIRSDIALAQSDDAKYDGGLIKSLIALRLQVLYTNAALVEQRIMSLESGVRARIVPIATNPDPARASELAREIESTRAKVQEGRREADRYSGGLTQAMAEATVATQRNTLAMLEQQYLFAKFGVAFPSGEVAPVAGSKASSQGPARSAAPSGSATARAPAAGNSVATCLKIQDFDSSVLSTNTVYTELAWKADVSNSCSESFSVKVTFTIYDKDEFELDSDSQQINVPANGVGKARGKMLVSPPDKASRMTKQGASLSRY
jgi:hypothetical protein